MQEVNSVVQIQDQKSVIQKQTATKNAMKKQAAIQI